MFHIPSDHQDMKQLQMQLEQDHEVKSQVFGNPFDQSTWSMNPINDHCFQPSFQSSHSSLQAFDPDNADDLNMANGLSLWLKFSEQQPSLSVDTSVLSTLVAPGDNSCSEIQSEVDNCPVTPKMFKVFVHKEDRKASLTIDARMAQATISPTTTITTPPSATLSSFSTAYSSSINTPLDFDMNGCNLSPTPVAPINEPAPKSIISRSTRACDTCRRRKLRCDVVFDAEIAGSDSKSISESCSRCKSANSTCMYTHVQKKRGPHSNSISGETITRARSNSRSSFLTSPKTMNCFQNSTPVDIQSLRGPSRIKPQRPVSMPPYTAAGPSFPHPFGTPVTSASVVRPKTAQFSPAMSQKRFSNRKHSITFPTEFERDMEMKLQLESYLKQHRGSESSSQSGRAARRATQRHSNSVGDSMRKQLSSPFMPSVSPHNYHQDRQIGSIYPGPVPSSMILSQVLDSHSYSFPPDSYMHDPKTSIEPYQKRRSMAEMQFVQNNPDIHAWY